MSLKTHDLYTNLAVIANRLYAIVNGGESGIGVLNGVQIKGAVKAVAFGVCLSASLGISACASNSVKQAATDLDQTTPKQTCKPTSTQVYQPPLKLGGAGRVIIESCKEE